MSEEVALENVFRFFFSHAVDYAVAICTGITRHMFLITLIFLVRDRSAGPFGPRNGTNLDQAGFAHAQLRLCDFEDAFQLIRSRHRLVLRHFHQCDEPGIDDEFPPMFIEM